MIKLANFFVSLSFAGYIKLIPSGTFASFLSIVILFPIVEYDIISLEIFVVINPYVTIVLIFILFRFFDILKIFPANIVDRKLKSAFGVILDDLIAGIYTIIILYIVNAYY